MHMRAEITLYACDNQYLLGVNESLINGLLCGQEYAAALQQILPDDYVASSHHARWAGSYVQALGACDSSIGGAISSAAAEVGM
jgi:hypothetical protein